MNLQVGQKLWYVPSIRHSNPREVTVRKIGRKWAELEPSYEGRISLETMAVDGGSYSSPGRCYLSKEEWQDQCYLEGQWEQFKRDFERVRYAPCRITLEQIKQLRQILGLEARA